MESVPSGESVTATESVFSVEHDAECTYISVPKKHSIKYKWDPFNRKKPPNPISVKELADESEDSDSEEVHLHHSFTCKLVDS